MLSLIEIGRVILEKKIFKFRQCILLFRCHLPLRKDMALHLSKHESPKDALCQSWLNRPNGSGEEDFKIS